MDDDSRDLDPCDPCDPLDSADAPPTALPPAAPERTLADARQAPPPRFPPDPLPPILRGSSINIIGGSPFAGKTPLMVWLIQQFTEGTVLGYPVPEGAVSEHVFLTIAGWLARTADWFTGLPVRAYSLSDDLAFNPHNLYSRRADRIEVLTEALTHHLKPKPGALVWVDPLTTFFNGSLLDPDACFVNAMRLRRIALLGQFTLIGTAVSSKQKISEHERQTTLLNRIAGSASFFGHMDTCLYLAPPSELDRTTHTLGLYPRKAPQQMFDLKQGEDGRFTYATPVEAHGLLRGAIPEPPGTITTGELQSLLCQPGGSISRMTLFRYLRQAVDAKVVRQVQRGVYQRSLVGYQP